MANKRGTAGSAPLHECLRHYSVLILTILFFKFSSGTEDDAFRPGQSILSPVAAASRDVRYLLYDVNPPEGFNLRRDVYIRMASLLKTLRKNGDWVLVLPPWGHLYHWQSPDIHQVRIPWGEFFSITSLQANIPVIEYEEFIAESGGPFIDQILVLQSYAEGWRDGKWEEKVDERTCIEKLMYSKDKQGYYRYCSSGALDRHTYRRMQGIVSASFKAIHE